MMSPPAWGQQIALQSVGLPTTPNIDPSKFPEEVFELYSVPSYSEGEPELLPGRDIKSAKQVVRPDDILLCKIVPHLNRVWRVKPVGSHRQIASGEWIVVRSSENNPDYLRYALTAPKFRENFMQTVSGVGGSLMRARPKAVAQLKIPIVSVEHQQRIVAKLDNLFARSRAAREELAHVPSLVERYKQAILSAAFRGEPTAEWRIRNGNFEWSDLTGGDLFTWTSGKFLPKKNQKPGDVPVFGGNGVNGFHSVPLVLHRTIVVGRVGALCGNVCLTDGPAWITDNAIYAKTIDARILSDYAFLVLSSVNLNSQAGGTGQPYVNQATLNAVKFRLPPLEEQREIVARVNAALASIKNLSTEQARAFNLLERLDQAALAKAFRGALSNGTPAVQAT